MNTEELVRLAEAELAEEMFRADVERHKERLRKQRAMPLWQRLIPFTITIKRRTDNV